MAVGQVRAATRAVGIVQAQCASHPSPAQPLATVPASEHFHTVTVFTGPGDVPHLDAVLSKQAQIGPEECYACGAPIVTQTQTAEWSPTSRTEQAVRDFLREFNGHVALSVTPTPPADGGMVVGNLDGDGGVKELPPPDEWFLGLFGETLVTAYPTEGGGVQKEMLDGAAAMLSIAGAHAVEPVRTVETPLQDVFRAFQKDRL